MNKWLKQNLNIGVILTLLTGYGVGAAYAAVLNSDVQTLKKRVDGMPEAVAVLQDQNKYIIKSLDRIEGVIAK